MLAALLLALSMLLLGSELRTHSQTAPGAVYSADSAAYTSVLVTAPQAAPSEAGLVSAAEPAPAPSPSGGAAKPPATESLPAPATVVTSTVLLPSAVATGAPAPAPSTTVQSRTTVSSALGSGLRTALLTPARASPAAAWRRRRPPCAT